MPNSFFQFKQFRIDQSQSGMKVTTDGCLFGAWVAKQISKMEAGPKNVLDIGTGTGLLSLMLAQISLRSQIDALEIDPNACEEAKRNFVDSPWSERLHGRQTSLQEFANLKPYELIICNPPFFKKNQKGFATKKNRAIHNDELSMEELSEGIAKHLAPDGMAFVLYPEWEMDVFVKWMEKQGLYPTHRVNVRNKLGAPVFRSMVGFGSSPSEVDLSELIIKEESGEYSAEFDKLLSGYYL